MATNPISKQFPATKSFTEIDSILKNALRYAYIFNSRIFKIDHIILGYMTYIEQESASGNHYYKMFPWYVETDKYREVTGLNKIESNPSKKLSIHEDVLALAAEYRTYRSNINLESFYYLIWFMNEKEFNKQYILKTPDIVHSTIFVETNFGHFLKQKESHKYTDLIVEKKAKSNEELNAWQTLHKVVDSFSNSEQPKLEPKVKSKNNLFDNPLETSLTRDITHLAFSDKLPVTVGRNAQISRLTDILSKVKKHNAILVGNPGVGKKSIIYGLAQRIIYNEITSLLRDYTILEFDSIACIEGCQYRGSFEAKMKQFEKELEQSNRKIIIMVEDIDNAINLGANEHGNNISLGSMFKNILSNQNIRIVGTTTPSGIRQIEKNKAFTSFECINIEEPSFDETLDILKNVSLQFKETYEILISESVLKSAITLSSRFIPERFLPDKAIDVLDESCTIKRNHDYSAHSISALTDENIMDCISRIKDIPVKKIQGAINFSDLEKHISKYVIGQDEAVSAVSKAIRRAQAGLTENTKPLASFLFLGPTGVGKTELSKVLADTMFPGGREKIIKLDMSEYMEKNSVSKLIGASPGYIGYDDGSLLTDKVKQHPYSLILFDELEKAHSSIYNILLQILDEGRLTDNQGTEVSFKNTVIVMTSNVGSKSFSRKCIGFGSTTSSKLDIDAELKNAFSPEFLNRIDEIMLFKQLDEAAIMDITRLVIKNTILTKMEEKNIDIEISEEIIREIAKKGYSQEFGARAIKRTVMKELLDPLSDFLLQNNEAKKIQISLDKNNLFKITAPDYVFFN